MLGLDPDCRVAIASYSGALASKFNRRVQRILESREYAAFFPATTIKRGARPPGYIRTADEVEVVGRRGGLLSVGREGSLTGNRVDCFILDDLYKDALEANSPLVRSNCWEWYTSVVRTRMHNASRELVVFTRWHEEDLIGELLAREPVEELREWRQLDTLPPGGWLHLNFEALKTSPPTEIDPRAPGEALWEEQHGAVLLHSSGGSIRCSSRLSTRGDPLRAKDCSTDRTSPSTTPCRARSSAGPTTPTRPIRATTISARFRMRSIPTGSSTSPMRSIRASRWR